MAFMKTRGRVKAGTRALGPDPGSMAGGEVTETAGLPDTARRRRAGHWRGRHAEIKGHAANKSGGPLLVCAFVGLESINNVVTFTEALLSTRSVQTPGKSPLGWRLRRGITSEAMANLFLLVFLR